MKTKYIIFLLLGFAWLAFAPQVRAQYSVTDYVVRANGDPWVDLAGQGTDIPEIAPSSAFDFERVSNEITLPFNYRFVNLITNKFKVEQDGSVICGGASTWPDGMTIDFGISP